MPLLNISTWVAPQQDCESGFTVLANELAVNWTGPGNGSGFQTFSGACANRVCPPNLAGWKSWYIMRYIYIYIMIRQWILGWSNTFQTNLALHQHRGLPAHSRIAEGHGVRLAEMLKRLTCRSASDRNLCWCEDCPSENGWKLVPEPRLYPFSLIDVLLILSIRLQLAVFLLAVCLGLSLLP